MNPNSQDEELSQLVRANRQVWPVKNPNFRAEVWARIKSNRRMPKTWGAWLRVNAARCTFLAVASISVASFGGGWIARTETSRNREILVQRYLDSIDPHQQTAADSR